MPRFFVTTSWDDGHPKDRKLADMLSKHGIRGTFYVPGRNSEGRTVLSPSDLHQISSAFEIGGHGADHQVLTTLSRSHIAQQIRENKYDLEQITGTEVAGFCYVRGRHNQMVRSIVREVEYRYARTIENFNATLRPDPFEMPTTIQFYPHGKIAYLKNYMRRPLSVTRARLFGAALKSGSLETRIHSLFESSRTCGDYFHLWGHSWEIDDNNLWADLDKILAQLSDYASQVQFVTNHDACVNFRRVDTETTVAPDAINDTLTAKLPSERPYVP